jgi:hypothetical protein
MMRMIEWHVERERERTKGDGWLERRGGEAKKPPVRSVWRHSKITTTHPFVASSIFTSFDGQFHSLPHHHELLIPSLPSPR